MPEIIAKTAAVHGELRDRPLPRLLQQLFRKRFTGYFVVTDETRDENQIYLREGWPVHVCRPVDTDRLDNLLIEYGLVPAEIVAQASAQVTEGLRLGDVLERMGAIDRQRLAQVLKAQVMRKLTRLFFVADGSYAVYVSGHGFGEGVEHSLMRLDPRTVIYPGIKAAYDLPRVTRELSRLTGQRFRLAYLSPGFVSALGIPQEDATIEALRGGWMTLGDLDSVTSRPFDVRSVVLAMYYTDSLEREAIVPSPTDSLVPEAIASTGSSGGYRISKLSMDSGAAFDNGSNSSAESGRTSETPFLDSPSAPQSVFTLTPEPVVVPRVVPVSAMAPPAVPAREAARLPVAPTAPPPAPIAPTAPPPAPAGPSLPQVVPAAARPSGTVPVVKAPMAPTPATKFPSIGNGNGATKGGTGVPAGVTGHVRSPSVSAMRAAPKAAPAAAATEAIRAAIQDMTSKLDKSTHFEILGVGLNATADEISVAFVRAARQFHPDRLTGPGVSDLQPQAERILSRINEAVMILQNPGRRAEYVASLTVGAPQASQSLPSLLECENLFLKGEVFLKKGDYPKAIEAFTLASKGNQDEPQYRAYLAWARFDDPHARKEAVVRETLKILEGVIKERPKFARGHYWVGLLWKFLNETPKSEQAFREAVQVDPEFIEASREVRLIEMRKSKPGAKPSQPEPPRGGGGLMGKFFKK